MRRVDQLDDSRIVRDDRVTHRGRTGEVGTGEKCAEDGHATPVHAASREVRLDRLVVAVDEGVARLDAERVEQLPQLAVDGAPQSFALVGGVDAQVQRRREPSLDAPNDGTVHGAPVHGPHDAVDLGDTHDGVFEQARVREVVGPAIEADARVALHDRREPVEIGESRCIAGVGFANDDIEVEDLLPALLGDQVGRFGFGGDRHIPPSAVGVGERQDEFAR